jgi:hypothetical protein
MDRNVARIKNDNVVQTHGERKLSAMLATCLSVGRASWFEMILLKL